MSSLDPNKDHNQVDKNPENNYGFYRLHQSKAMVMAESKRLQVYVAELYVNLLLDELKKLRTLMKQIWETKL